MSTSAAAPAAKNDGVKLLIKVVVGGLLAGLLFLLLLVIGLVVWKSRQQAASATPLSQWDTTRQAQIFFRLQPGQNVPVRVPWDGPNVKIVVSGYETHVWPVDENGVQLAEPLKLPLKGRSDLRDHFGAYEWLNFSLSSAAGGPSSVRISHD